MTMETQIDATTGAEAQPIAHVRGLESSALRGTYWVVLFYGLSMALRLGGSIVLSRIFMPKYFGLMTLVTTVIIGINLFSHVGVQESIIQDPRGEEPTFLNTAWTLQGVRGLGLCLLTIPLGWPVARFYHEPQIIALLPLLGLGCLIAGVSSPSLLLLSRHLGVGRLSALELFTQFVQLAVTIVWALFQPTIWALMAGKVISEVCRTVVSYGLLPEMRPRFTWDRAALDALVKFGRWILIGTALTFLALQSDRLILAKLVSLQMLGVYGIAYTLSDVPRQIILMFCSRVGFPFIAKFSNSPRAEFHAILLKYRRLVLVAGGLMIVLVVCVGDQFILHVYTRPYHAAAWMVPLLAVGLWHTLLYSTISPAILSLKKAHYNAFAYLAYCVTLFVCLPWAFHVWGMVGAVTAVAFSDVPMYVVNAFSARREGLSTLQQDGFLTAAFAGALVLALWARVALGFGSPFPFPFLR